MTPLSARLAAVVDALPLKPGLRVLEIGGAGGATARAVAERIPGGHILMIDRSATSIKQASKAAADEIDAGVMRVREVAAEQFQLLPGEEPFDLAFAIRVGAFDGRHPSSGRIALQRITAALTPEGRMFIDTGDPLHELDLPRS